MAWKLFMSAGLAFLNVVFVVVATHCTLWLIDFFGNAVAQEYKAYIVAFAAFACGTVLIRLGWHWLEASDET